MYDLHNNIKVLNTKAGTLSNDTALVITADLKGYLSAELLIITGALGDANMTFALLVEDSADNTTFAAVVDDYLLGVEAPETLDFADDNKAIKIGYAGPKRYLKLTVTPAGNTDPSPYALVARGRNPRVAPITTQVEAAS